MKTKNIFLAVIVISLLAFQTGCKEIRGKFAETRNKIITHFGEGYKPEMQFSIGEGGILVSSWIVGLAADEDYIDNMMRDISGVQIQIYEKINNSDVPRYSVLNDIEAEMNSSGWKSIVRSYDNDELTAVYLSTDRDEYLNKLFVISCNDDELVFVEVEGDLKGIISTAIKEKGFEFNM